MVSEQSVRKQLSDIGFKQFGWGRGEVRELPNILLPDEQIFECVNGLYEGGFALLVATDVRVLLVDKKPLNFLTVEDLRFDMINEIDYSHRLFGAYINVTSGEKKMNFRSYDQARLRKLITHVQHCMADGKKKQHNHQEGQNQHLEQINHQLQAYLIAQHQHQQELHEHLKVQGGAAPQPQPIKPSPELADYLYAQGLLAQYRQQTGQVASPARLLEHTPEATIVAPPVPPPAPASPPIDDIYAEGIKEVFGSRQEPAAASAAAPPVTPAVQPPPAAQTAGRFVWPPLNLHKPLEINALRIAYSKLPTVLRSRKFARKPKPVFQSRSEVEPSSAI